ncbi:hypothetical protein OG592_21550 [Streptomyces avidinii]|nr:hypothetical protein OG592_21550 [Streptomyces avidinii]
MTSRDAARDEASATAWLEADEQMPTPAADVRHFLGQEAGHRG